MPPGAQLSLPGTLGPGIDLKCNGYIVVEPSIHPSGKAYGWEASSNPLDHVVPSPLPDWLRSLRVHLDAPRPAAGDIPVDPKTARDVREALYVLDAEDYHQWVQAGMALHHTGWGDGGEWDQTYAYFDRAWGNILGNLKKRYETGPVDWTDWMARLRKFHEQPPAAKP